MKSARRIGVRVDRTFVSGYIASSLLTTLRRDAVRPDRGRRSQARRELHAIEHHRRACSGGSSLRGGRGTFSFGTVLGALLLTEVLDAAIFLGLSETYQYVFQGISS